MEKYNFIVIDTPTDVMIINGIIVNGKSYDIENCSKIVLTWEPDISIKINFEYYATENKVV